MMHLGRNKRDNNYIDLYTSDPSREIAYLWGALYEDFVSDAAHPKFEVKISHTVDVPVYVIYKDDLDLLLVEIDSLRSDIRENEQTIERMEDDIAAMETELAALEDELAALEDDDARAISA